MDFQPSLSFQQLFNHVVGDMAKAVSVRGGDTPEQRYGRFQAATHMIMGFLPRDVIEAMLAGRCVMLHEVSTDSIRETLSGEVDTLRRATRANIVALDRCFAANLTRLERYQKRPSNGRRDGVEVEDAAGRRDGVEAEDAAGRPGRAEAVVGGGRSEVAAGGVGDGAAKEAVSGRSRGTSGLGTTGLGTAELGTTRQETAGPGTAGPGFTKPGTVIPAFAKPAVRAQAPLPIPRHVLPRAPSPEQIAACQANPEAMAALDAGDAAGFARAMGIEPVEAFLVASKSAGSPFSRPDETASLPGLPRPNGG